LHKNASSDEEAKYSLNCDGGFLKHIDQWTGALKNLHNCLTQHHFKLYYPQPQKFPT